MRPWGSVPVSPSRRNLPRARTRETPARVVQAKLALPSSTGSRSSISGNPARSRCWTIASRGRGNTRWPATPRTWVGASSAEERSGFQRLLTEVTLRHVGLILGLELSRLCRSNRDWAYLSDVCSVFDTLLGDQDGIYDPNDVNDRMVLGLKGILSEMELTLMRNRLERGRQHKAARGELFQRVPIGYVKLPSGQVAFDPDEQVRAVVRLVFAKYDELGSVYALWRYLLQHKICLGVRHGP